MTRGIAPEVFKVPENLGCMPSCIMGRELAEALREDVDAGGEKLAKEMTKESQQLLSEHKCAFINDGSCILGRYVMTTALAYRMLHEEFSPGSEG